MELLFIGIILTQKIELKMKMEMKSKLKSSLRKRN